MGKLIGIDYGLKRVGFAISDEEKIIASRLCNKKTHESFEFLKTFIQNNDIDAIIIGLPKDLKNNNTDITNHVKSFAKKIRKSFIEIPVYYEDERFTSKIAYNSLITLKLKRNKLRQKELIDEVSAVIILQSYMYKN